MTPSEHLWALAAERANAPEHMRELFALAIDRATWRVADKINHDLGRSVAWEYPLPSRFQESEQSFYAETLHHYVQLKLLLHRVKKLAMPLWDCDASWLIEKEDKVRARIKAARAVKANAIWGDLKPEK